MLKMNGFQVVCSQEAKVALILKIIGHQVTVQDVADWLTKHSKRSHE